MRATDVQGYARVAGILILVSAVAGGFGEFFVPVQLVVPNDAAATANNIKASEQLFRLSVAAYLVEAICDLALTLVFYVLLRPVGRELALLAAFFRLVATATFAVGELFYFAPSFILGGGEHLRSFSPDQLNALALLSLKFYGYSSGIFPVFYGVASVLLGYLTYRSGYLPRILGVLFALGGLGFVTMAFTLVLTPGYASSLLLLPTAVAGLSLAVWLLVKGVNVQQWEAKAALAEHWSV